MTDILRIVTAGSAVLLILFVLLQARGADLGSGFGGSGELFTARRGIDKTMYQITVVLAVIFVLSIMLSLMVV